MTSLKVTLWESHVAWAAYEGRFEPPAAGPRLPGRPLDPDRRLPLRPPAGAGAGGARLGGRRLSLPAGFPFPTAAELATAPRRCGAARTATVLVDGLAFGAMPEIAAEPRPARPRGAGPPPAVPGDRPGTRGRRRRSQASERAALAARAAVVVTSTAAPLRDLLGVAAGRITVAVPGTDPAPVARGSGGPASRMLCVGTVTPRKGHLVLVEALAGSGATSPGSCLAPAAPSATRPPPRPCGRGSRPGLALASGCLGELDPEGAGGRSTTGRPLRARPRSTRATAWRWPRRWRAACPMVAAAGGGSPTPVPPAAGCWCRPGRGALARGAAAAVPVASRACAAGCAGALAARAGCRAGPTRPRGSSGALTAAA